MKTITSLLLLLLSLNALQAQSDEDVQQVDVIFDEVLTNSSAYDWLHYLCKKIGPRVSGSAEGMAAVEYSYNMLDTLGLDRVWKQPVTVPHWERGEVERAKIVASKTLGDVELAVCALGFSAPTPQYGITAEVIEVEDMDALENLGSSEVKGKIVFLNEPMDATLTNTFHAYGRAVSQRTSGPRIAAQKGAVATLVRSLTLKEDDVPHSGVTIFRGTTPIPAAGLGIQSAERLSALIAREGSVRVNLELQCQRFEDKESYNVIGEIKGSTYPNEIIVVGGHLDSWDIGEGAHDDGTGCVQAMEVLHLFKRLGIRPKRTIRCVLFANEENGMNGAASYAAYAKGQTNEKHIAAIESDAGGHAPRGFAVDAQADDLKRNYDQIQEWRSLLAPKGAYYMDTRGGSAADISKLKPYGTLLFGFRPDSQRYFDYHHARTDVFEAVHKRELEMGAASMAALVYLIDQYGKK